MDNFEIGPNAEWIRCGTCGMRSYNPNDVKQRYCGNCRRFLEDDASEWLRRTISYLRDTPSNITAEQWAHRLHEALEIAEAKRYATPVSRFIFSFSGATDEDLAEIRKHLTPFENSIVELKHKKEKQQ